jgi:hypothetical protein
MSIANIVGRFLNWLRRLLGNRAIHRRVLEFGALRAPSR